MLSSVPIPRLLEGIATSLGTNVAPFVDDKFAQMQLRAIDEVLRNLAHRVDWDIAEVRQEADGWGIVLEFFQRAGWPGRVPSPVRQFESAAEVIGYRHEMLTLANSALDWAFAIDVPSPESRDALAAYRSHAHRSNAAERELFKSGMYK